MSRFYANIQGNRGEATRQGTAASGIVGHIRGWNLGARVIMHEGGDGCDRVDITITGGSTGRYAGVGLGQWYRNEDGDLVHAPIEIVMANGTIKEVRNLPDALDYVVVFEEE